MNIYRGLFMIMLVFVSMFAVTAAQTEDIKKFKNGMTFNHTLHQTERVGKCFVCHENVSVSGDGTVVTTSKPGKIKGFGKEWAHKYCTDCHDLFGEGPVTCKDCHLK
jgi:hypothetical protein